MMQREYAHKPSISTLRAAAFRAVNAGETWIQFTWGENQITLEKTRWGWDGHGWIGRNGGSDLAREITRAGQSNN